MAPKGTAMGLALCLVLALWNGAAAQSGCTSTLLTLSPCLNYVQGKSSTPSSSCCSVLSNVVQSKPLCLCALLNGGGSTLGITVNQTLALALPGACNVQTPPISRCNAASAPTASAAAPPPAAATDSAPVGSPPPAESPESASVGSPSPAGSPSDSSDATVIEPSDSSNPSAGGSKTVPSTVGASSGGSTIKSPLQVAVFLLFIVSCASGATIF